MKIEIGQSHGAAESAVVNTDDSDSHLNPPYVHIFFFLPSLHYIINKTWNKSLRWCDINPEMF